MRFNQAFATLQNLIKVEINQAELGRVLGVSRANINYKKQANVLLSDEDVKKIETYYNISLTDETQNKITISDDILLDYFPEVYASCGNGAEPFSTRCEKMNVSKALIKGYDSHKRYNVINTTSDSMEPEIRARDFLVIETEPESIKDNHIYVFTYENEIYCKYLAKNIKEIIIRSANSLYNDVFLVGEERSKMKILGEVVAVIRDYTR